MTLLFNLPDVASVAAVMRDGGVVAYPTEAVFGLGCNPFDRSAVERICELKERDLAQGLLLVASDIAQLVKLVDWSSLPDDVARNVGATWPGPTTWILPRGNAVPRWVTGDRDGIAVRVTSHGPTASLCRAYGGALISTSANPHGQAPARDAAGVLTYFDGKVDAVLDEAVGNASSPSRIIDALTGQVLRS